MKGDGRFIDPTLGTLGGEAAEQSTPAERAFAEGSPEFATASKTPIESYESNTYFERPVVKEPVWIWAVPAYFYVGGVAGAASVLGAAAQVVDREGAAPLIVRCRRIAAFGCVVGSVLLVHDLGRPSRFLNMLRVFRPTSALNMGSWVLASSTGLTTLAALGAESDGLPGALADLMGLGAAVMGLPLTGYTAVVLSDTAVPVWQASRRSMPALFVASAIAGLSDVLEVMDLDDRQRRVVDRFGRVGKVAGLIATVAVEKEAGEVERVGRPLKEGLGGTLWKAAKVLTAASLGVSLLPGSGRAKRFATATLGTAGAVAVKSALFHAGRASARDPRATFEQQRAR
jgi:formate-dependent nitrite reductase membrane component NrfD